MARAVDGLDMMQLREVDHGHAGVLAFVMTRPDGAATVIRRPALDCYLIGIGLNIATIHIEANGRNLRRGTYGPHGTHLVQPQQTASYGFTGRLANVRLRLSETAVAAALEQMDRSSGGIELADVSEHAEVSIGRLSRRLLRAAFAEPADRLCTDSLMQLLVDHVVLTYASRPIKPRWREGLPPHSLRRVMAMIRAEFRHEITLDALAAAAGLSRAHFLRGFRREVGTPPHAFVTTVRLREAGALIRQTQRRFAVIAAATGYASHAI